MKLRPGGSVPRSPRVPLIESAGMNPLAIAQPTMKDPSQRIDRWGVGLTACMTCLLGVVIWRVATLQLAPDPRLAMFVSDHSGTQSVPARRRVAGGPPVRNAPIHRG